MVTSSSRIFSSFMALTLLAAPPAAALADLLEDELLDGPHYSLEVAGGGHRACPQGSQEGQAMGRVDPVGHRHETFPQQLEALALQGAEDGPHHDLEADCLHAGPQLEGLAQRPLLDLAACHLAHHLPVGLHAGAVEGGQQVLAVAHVLGLVQEHHRAGAQQGLEQRIGFRRPGAHQGGVGREDLLDVLGVGQEDPGTPAADPEGEGLAVVLLAAIHEGQRAQSPAEGLKGAWHFGPGRQLLAAGIDKSVHQCVHSSCHSHIRDMESLAVRFHLGASPYMFLTS
jgi:hypothetical protein